jgi:hypothetical protein
VALMAPMLILAVSASSFVGLRCRMSGMISVATCCPGGADALDDAPAQSAVDAPGCCDRVVVELARPVGAAVAAAGLAGAAPRQIATSVLWLATMATAPFAIPRAGRALARGAPPGLRPRSLPLLKHALLI